jgi:hypothetical protein
LRPRWHRSCVSTRRARLSSLANTLQKLLVNDLTDNVADHPTEIGLQLAQGLVGALELVRMGVALLCDERQLAHAGIGLAKLDPCPPGKPDHRSRARLRSLASVGKATALGCTVVSTITRAKSLSFIARVLVATISLSCTRALRRFLAHV